MATFDPAKTALIALSMTKGIMANYDAGLVANGRRAAEAARAAGVPVLHGVVQFRPGYPEVVPGSGFEGFKNAGVAMEDGGPQVEPHPDVYADGEIILRKRRVGAFAATDLDDLLRAQGRSQIVLMGVRTTGAIMYTSCWGADSSYQVGILSDAIADPNEEAHRVLTGSVFGNTLTVDEFAAQLRP